MVHYLRARKNNCHLLQIDLLREGDEVHVIDDKDTFILMQKNIDNYHPTQEVVSFILSIQSDLDCSNTQNSQIILEAFFTPLFTKPFLRLKKS